MRSKINLATQPYEDAQQYLLRWGPVVFLLLLVTIGKKVSSSPTFVEPLNVSSPILPISNVVSMRIFSKG